MREEIKCKICDKTFKSKSGLAGHMKIEHGIMKRVTYPDEVAKRLKVVESQVKILSKEFAPQVLEVLEAINKWIHTSDIKLETTSKEEEHIKEPAQEQKKITQGEQIKLLEDMLKDRLDQKDMLLKYDQEGKPVVVEKLRRKGSFF